MFGRATITLGIGPHSSFCFFVVESSVSVDTTHALRVCHHDKPLHYAEAATLP